MSLVLVAGGSFASAVIASGAIGGACALLSVFVVSRRWAFIGEGIGHAGLGGAGTAWLLSLAIPALDQPGAVFGGVVVFCLATALLIGWVNRRERVNSDAAIGIFLVASLAWGFLAREVYQHFRRAEPAGFSEYLFGYFTDVSAAYAIASVLVGLAVAGVVTMLGKEIVYYSFDPAMAEASGVRGGLVHYLMMGLLAITIIAGIRIAGSVLVTALLVLPGATALLLSSRLKTVIVISVALGLVSAVGGVAVSARWRYLPAGPMMVLILFAIFFVVFCVTKSRPAPARV
jgi:manganese/iron transport system permease protein